MNQSNEQNTRMTGNIFVYYAYDVGEDIDLGAIEQSNTILTRPLNLAKYFKGYHVPLAIDLPHPHTSSHSIGAKLHNFGVISLAYRIPFADTLENLREQLNEVDIAFREQSVEDAHLVFKKIKKFIKQPRFFHLRSSYVLIQVDQQSANTSISEFKREYGGIIASLLRFETESLSEYQKNAILESTIGYYRGDMIVIDIDSAFLYDSEYEDLLELFEFANIQKVELQYYDRLLDQQLNVVYQRNITAVSIKAYLPIVGAWMRDPISDLGMLRVEISAIIERLESAVKASGDVYVTETYQVLVETLDLPKWKESIGSKLDIIKDIHQVYQNKLEAVREDLLSILIVVLIFTELIVGILSYFKR
ncbi:MAG: hypothetical protein WCE21_05350 [Candidatus Babeliales bacterium]